MKIISIILFGSFVTTNICHAVRELSPTFAEGYPYGVGAEDCSIYAYSSDYFEDEYCIDQGALLVKYENGELRTEYCKVNIHGNQAKDGRVHLHAPGTQIDDKVPCSIGVPKGGNYKISARIYCSFEGLSHLGSPDRWFSIQVPKCKRG